MFNAKQRNYRKYTGRLQEFWWAPLAAAGISAAGSLVGGSQGSGGSIESQRQEQFARMGIQWRVEDAKAAGIHPLAALGVSTPNYIPSSTAAKGMGIADAGRALGRGVAASARNYAGRQDVEIARQTGLANLGLMAAQKGRLEELTRASIQARTSQAARSGNDVLPDDALTFPLSPGQNPTRTHLGGSRRRLARLPGGGTAYVDPARPTAKWADDRYGDEVMEWLEKLPLYLREKYSQNPTSWFNWHKARKTHKSRMKNYRNRRSPWR